MEKILFDGLNEHRFLFREKCADVLRNKASQTKWRVEEIEYPVSTEVRNTRIDIVLSNTTDYSPNKHQIYTIVEGNRVNQSRGYWLFGKPASPSNEQSLILRLKAEYSSTGNYSTGWSKPKCNLNIKSPLVDNW